jgi:hypothetical protein
MKKKLGKPQEASIESYSLLLSPQPLCAILYLLFILDFFTACIYLLSAARRLGTKIREKERDRDTRGKKDGVGKNAKDVDTSPGQL